MAEELADVQNQQNEEIINKTASTPDRPVIGQDTSKKLSLRDEIKKNFKEAQAPVESAKPKKEPDKPAKAEERPRDETGKFVAKDTVEPEAPTESPQPTKEVSPEASDAIRPPPGWSAESKAAFNTLPDHLKNDILKREKEISDGFKTKSEELKRYQEIEQVLSAARPVYQQNGIKSDAEAIKRLFAWEQYIRANPQQAIQEIARQYGVTFAQPSPTQEDPQSVMPVIEQVRQEIGSIKSEFQRSQEERIANELAIFAKDKPYFDRVRVQMGQLMNAGIATDLATAYQKAIALNPEVQAEIKSDEEAKRLIEQQKQNQERVQKVQKAAQAAVSPSTRAPSAALPSTAKTPGIRGSILQAIEEVRGNGRA